MCQDCIYAADRLQIVPHAGVSLQCHCRGSTTWRQFRHALQLAGKTPRGCIFCSHIPPIDYFADESTLHQRLAALHAAGLTHSGSALSAWILNRRVLALHAEQWTTGKSIAPRTVSHVLLAACPTHSGIVLPAKTSNPRALVPNAGATIGSSTALSASAVLLAVDHITFETAPYEQQSKHLLVISAAKIIGVSTASSPLTSVLRAAASTSSRTVLSAAPLRHPTHAPNAGAHTGR